MQPRHQVTLTQPFTLRERSYSCKAQCNSIGNSSTSNTCNPIYSEGTILQLQITMEFHRQLIHQQHLQPHLQCGNDPTVANHNGILSPTHARKTVGTPFTMRNRSEHDPTTSENDPTTHETVSHPSHRRGRSSRFGDTLCMEKHRVSCIARLPSKLHRQLIQQHHLQSHLHCGNNPRVANGIPSATHPPAPLATPFTMRERSYTVANHNGILSPTHAFPQLTPHLQCGTDPSMIRPHPRMIRPHTRPSRTRRTAESEVDHRGLGAHFVWKNIGFRSSAILKNAFRARLPSKLHRQLIQQHHLQSHLQWGNNPTVANHNGIPSATHPPAPLATPFTMRERSYSCKSQWNSVAHTCTKNSWHPIYNAEPIRAWSDHIRTWSDPEHRLLI